MYALIYSDNEMLKSDNEVKVFDTFDEASYEMRMQLDGAAADAGLDIIIPEGDGNFKAFDKYGDPVYFAGYIVPEEAYLDATEQKWVVIKVEE